MKRAIVLSGGGSKGAYQIGFWKAIRELDITYDIVTGTSIGALNGAFMVQGNYSKAFKLWYFMDYSKVLDNKIDASFNTPSGKRKIIMKYAKGALKGGMNVSALEKTITDNFNADLFFNSPIDYGLVTVRFPSLKPVMLTKNKLSKDNIKDYLLASASCFPAFKMKNINDKSYIDGGYYDNLPINLAVELGATEVIAVNLKAVGTIRRVMDPSIKITTISPKNDIGNFLVMEKEQARRSIKLGYNDTMKAFKVLEGDKYTFKRGSLYRNYSRNKDHFFNLVKTYTSNLKNNSKYKNVINKDSVDYFNRILEQTALAFGIDETKIYRTSVINVLIKKAFKKTGTISFKNIKREIKDKKLKKYFVNKELICYIYAEINKSKKAGKTINNLALFFPNSYLCALYLKAIMR